MTPADEINAAATRLRADALAARAISPPPWNITSERVIRAANGDIIADRSEASRDPDEAADLPYLADVQPGVGLALADWLEAEAQTWAGDEVHYRCSPTTCTLDAALATARAINGAQP